MTWNTSSYIGHAVPGEQIGEPEEVIVASPAATACTVQAT